MSPVRQIFRAMIFPYRAFMVGGTVLLGVKHGQTTKTTISSLRAVVFWQHNQLIFSCFLPLHPVKPGISPDLVRFRVAESPLI